MSKSREITPKWILITLFVAIVLGFMIGIISVPNTPYAFDVLPIVLASGPIVIILAVIYVYLTEWSKKEKEE